MQLILFFQLSDEGQNIPSILLFGGTVIDSDLHSCVRVSHSGSLFAFHDDHNDWCVMVLRE